MAASRDGSDVLFSFGRERGEMMGKADYS